MQIPILAVYSDKFQKFYQQKILFINELVTLNNSKEKTQILQKLECKQCIRS